MLGKRRGLAALEDLTQLQSLDLSDTPVTSTGMATVARMRGLHTLALSFGGAPHAQAALNTTWDALITLARTPCNHPFTGYVHHARHLRPS